MTNKIILSIFLLFILRGGIAQTVSRTPPINLGFKPGWSMVWMDDFDANEIDRNRWKPDSNLMRGTDYNCAFLDRPENIYQKNGQIHFAITKTGVDSLPYIASNMATNTWLVPNQYVEISAKMPEGKGIWPALWFWNGADTFYCEVDLVEFRGSKTDRFYITHHYYDKKKKERRASAITVRPRDERGKKIRLNEGFNVYGFEWTPEVMRFYFNNTLVREIKTNIPRIPMFIVMGTGTGTYDGAMGKDVKFPNVTSVEYIRVYQKN